MEVDRRPAVKQKQKSRSCTGFKTITKMKKKEKKRTVVQQHLKKTRLKGQTVKLFTLYPHHGGQMKLLPEAL